MHPQLSSDHIAIVGNGYGAIVATHLNLLEHYKVAVLVNPITDLGAMSSSQDLAEWPYHIQGFNYTSASVPTDILVPSWEK